MEELLHSDLHWLEGSAAASVAQETIVGSITSDEEERQLEALNEWIEAKGLPPGNVGYDFADEDMGQQRAVFDLTWPAGIQEELSQPVAVLLEKGNEVIALANQAGYRCFVSVPDFQRYVETEILVEEEAVREVRPNSRSSAHGTSWSPRRLDARIADRDALLSLFQAPPDPVFSGQLSL